MSQRSRLAVHFPTFKRLLIHDTNHDSKDFTQSWVKKKNVVWSVSRHKTPDSDSETWEGNYEVIRCPHTWLEKITD